jgi:hypothetical protein
MTTLIDVILIAMAVAYVVEAISALGAGIFSAKIVRNVLTLPLSLYGCWILDTVGFQMVVSSLAASFLSLTLMILVNKVSEARVVVNRR